MGCCMRSARSRGRQSSPWPCGDPPAQPLTAAMSRHGEAPDDANPPRPELDRAVGATEHARTTTPKKVYRSAASFGPTES